MRTVAVPIDGTGVVVIIEDDERLRAIDLGLHLGDVAPEVRRAQLGPFAEADQHVHGKLQLIFCDAAVPFIELDCVGQVGFADQNAVAGVFVHHGAHAADHVVYLGQVVRVGVADTRVAVSVRPAKLRIIAQLGVFKERGDGVQTEAGDPTVEPEPHHVEHGSFHRGVTPVQIGLLFIELVVVELLAGRNPLPGGAAEAGDPVVRGHHLALGTVVLVAALKLADPGGVGGDPVVPDVPVGLGVCARAGGLFEPLVLVGGVVQHHVQHDADVALLCLGLQLVEVGKRAVLRIDVLVVGDVVAEVDLRRRIHGRNPDRINPESLQVVELLRDAVQVADAVTVGVLEAAGIDLVNHRMLPPGLIHAGRDRGGEGGRDCRGLCQSGRNQGGREQKGGQNTLCRSKHWDSKVCSRRNIAFRMNRCPQ